MRKGRIARLLQPQNSIATRLIIAVILFSSLITLITTALQLFVDYKQDLTGIQDEFETIEQTYLPSLINSVWVADKMQIETQLSGLMNLPGIEAVAISVNGRNQWERGTSSSAHVTTKIFDLRHSYREQERLLGKLHVSASLDAVYSRLWDKVVLILAGNALKTFLVAGFILVIFHYLVTRHLIKLAAYTSRLSPAEDTSPLVLDRLTSAKTDELTLVVDAVNEMRTRIVSSYRELDQGRQQLEMMMQAVPVPMAISRYEDGTLLFANSHVAPALGLEPDDTLGRRMVDFYRRPERREYLKQLLRRYDRIEGEEVELERADGTDITILMSAQNMNYKGYTAVFFGFHDITKLKCMETDLRDAKQKADAANHAKTEFLFNISHELRTPLNSIIGFSDIIRNEMFGSLGNGSYVQYANDINTSGSHLLGLISDLLEVSRIETGKIDLEEGTFDLGEILADVPRMLSQQIRNAELDVEFDIAPDLPHLLADKRRVLQVMINLTSNAIKFTPPGGRLTLSVRLCEHGGLHASISDTGIGIPEEEQTKVMDSFVQVGSALTRDHSGLGLGLSMSRSIMDLHGGKLDLQSCVGRGTQVTACFPASRSVARPAPKRAKIKTSLPRSASPGPLAGAR